MISEEIPTETVTTSQRCTEFLGPEDLETDINLTLSVRSCSRSMSWQLMPANSHFLWSTTQLTAQVQALVDEGQMLNQLRKMHCRRSSNQRRCKISGKTKVQTKNQVRKKKQLAALVIALKGGESCVNSLRKTACCRAKYANHVLKAYENGFSIETEEIDLKSQSLTLKDDILSYTTRLVDPFFTASQTKRELKNSGKLASRKLIAKVFRSEGFTYGLARPLGLKKKPFITEDTERLKKIISILLDSLKGDEENLLFIDETKFQLQNIPTRIWYKKSAIAPLVSRETESCIVTAIAACSTEGFKAVQLFLGEIKAQDYLYFLFILVNKMTLKRQDNLVILQDGPRWHTAEILQKSSVWKYLLTNIKSYFDLNLIENAFSCVKYHFKRRPIVLNIEEELHAIVNCFSKSNDINSFAGYTRNLVRSMLKRLRQVVTYYSRRKKLKI